MNTKLLKQKILDLARRGKLTEQRKSDGTARELLERILDEKRKADEPSKATKQSKDTKSKTPERIVPLDKNDAPFEIPENWEWVRLGDVAYIASGSTPSKDSFVESGVPYLKMYNLRNQKIDFDFKPQYIKREIHEGKLARSMAKPGDVIMNIVGPPLGKVALIPDSLPECNFNQAAVMIRTHYCANLMNQYIRYFLLQMDEINAINTKGTAGQENISLTQTQNMRLPLPPLAEQRRIVAKIEEAFAEIDAIEKKKESLKRHIAQARQKILDLAIHGKLVPQNKADGTALDLLKNITHDKPHYGKMGDVPFEIPASWAWVKLGEVCAYGECENTDVKSIPETAWILELEDIEKDSGKIIRFLTKSERNINGVRHSFKKGDVLYSKLRTYLNKVLVAPNDGFCTTEIIPIKVGVLSSKYVCYVLRSQYFMDYTALCGYGVKMPRLSTADARKGLFPLPPLAEQKRIVEKIENVFASLDEISLHLV